MDNMVVINNLDFKYNSHVVFNNLCLSIKKSSFTTILGNNGAGKSSLLKLILGFNKGNGTIFVDNKLLIDKNIFNIRKNIGVVFENPDNCLISETVLDDLAFPLLNLNYSREYIYSRINEVSKYLGISHLLDCDPHSLSGGEKQLVCLGCCLMTAPKLIILDEAFSMIDDLHKLKILKFLKNLNRKYGVTIINITHDIEESVYGDNIAIIDSGKVVINDKKDIIYKNEKLLKSIGFDLPFMVDLSNRLSYYGLVEKTIYDMEEMVDLLWK